MQASKERTFGVNERRVWRAGDPRERAAFSLRPILSINRRGLRLDYVQMPRIPTTATLSHLFSAASVPSQPVFLCASSFKSLPALDACFQRGSDGLTRNVNEAALLLPPGTADPLVTVELTALGRDGGSFERLESPWSAYVSYLSSPPPPSSSSSTRQTLYLAQQPPPAHLVSSFTLPSSSSSPLPSRTAKTSLWLGYTPTTTPLHRDPDDNVLCQLAGRKIVRLCEPARGQDVLDAVRGGSRRGSKMRGEEMMRPGPGGERDALEARVWDAVVDDDDGQWWEARIEEGQGLFIPRGWWHAVRGRRRVEKTREGAAASVKEKEELNASVNWWFR